MDNVVILRALNQVLVSAICHRPYTLEMAKYKTKYHRKFNEMASSIIIYYPLTFSHGYSHEIMKFTGEFTVH